ncbi:MAG: baseplate J/gp47 family protein [Eubacterium sp.]
MQTYEQILNRMKSAYFDAASSNPENNTDAMLRLQAVASELYNLSCYGDFALKQTSYRTASGEYLDQHANICGLERKTPRKARGRVKFSVSEPAEQDINIPQGVICSVKDKPFIQFVTLSDAQITQGSLSVDADIEALDFGEEYNVAKDSITVMVNPPSVVETVNNESTVMGGCSRESDETLRRRIKDSYEFIHNGISLNYYIERICNIDDVLDCRIVVNGSSLTVTCRTKSGVLDDDIKSEIRNILGIVELFNSTIVIKLASALSVDFEVIVRGGEQADVEEVLRKYIDGLRICEGVIERECERLICDACSANACEVYASDVGPRSVEYSTLGEVRVYYYE